MNVRDVVSLFVFLISISLPAAAFADWSAAFPADAVKTYVSSSEARVMVVSVEADAATAALIKSLKGSAVVMKGSALGDVSDLGDAEIAAKAGNQPIDQLIIVRTTGSEEDATAVVTLYARDGTSLGGFTASTTTPAPPSDGGGASQSEMSSAVAEAEARSNDPNSRDEFLDSFVGFEDWVGINQYGNVVSSWAVPFKGRDRIPLRGADFYEEIRKPELAAKYRRRRNVKTGVGIGSVVLTLGGVAVALSPLLGERECIDSDPVSDICYERKSILGPAFWVGMGMVAAGSIGITVSGALNPHPVDPPTARKLAREHNERLAEELGIDLQLLVEELSEAPRPKPQIRFGLVPLPDGAGVAVGGQF